LLLAAARPVAEAVHVLLDLGVIEIGCIAPADLADDLLADPALGRGRKLGRRHVAQVGQIVGKGRHRGWQGQRQAEQQGERSAHHRVL
jgi:hypothetical protein